MTENPSYVDALRGSLILMWLNYPAIDVPITKTL
jgi:hypothetical protein